MRNFNITVNGQTYSVAVDEVNSAAPVAVAPATAAVPAPTPAPAPAPATAGTANGTKINAPMPGNIVDVVVKVGDAIKTGQNLLVLEAMKMENDIVAPQDGTIVAVAVSKGTTVSTGDLLVVIG